MAGELRLINKMEVQKLFKNIPESIQGKIALDAVKAGAFIIEKYAKIKIDEHGLRKRGHLINSIKVYDATNDGFKSYCFVGSRGVIYARVHEFGATIKAKRAKNLAIPMTKQAEKAGSPRRFSGDLVFIPSRMGRGGVLATKNKKGALSVQYVLKPMVLIPMRPYLRPAGDEHKNEIKEEMIKVIKSGLESYKI